MNEAGVSPGCCRPIMYINGFCYLLLKLEIEIMGIGLPMADRHKLDRWTNLE